MSQWHNEHPDLVGTDADPWMIHEDYRKAVGAAERRILEPPDEPDENPDALDAEDIAYLRAEASDEWQAQGGGGL
jgi:hypothetical protein